MGFEDWGPMERSLKKLISPQALKGDYEVIGAAVARAIIQTTLAGIGAGDKSFVKYSKGYQKRIDSVGGKPGGVVNLRGLFYHATHRRARFKTYRNQVKAGEGLIAGKGNRRGKAEITNLTRPQKGVTDSRSEMSLDLLRVVVRGDKIVIEYTPRVAPYMLYHQNGTGRQPQRAWFSTDKTACRIAARQAFDLLMRKRIAEFNSQSRRTV